MDDSDSKNSNSKPSDSLLVKEHNGIQQVNGKGKEKSASRENLHKNGLLKNIRSFPKSVFFCLGCEFSERFSFYGMRAIMVIYFITWKGLQPSEAKLLYHAFVCLAYFTPLFGSLLADGLLGKFKTILSLSLVYCIGHSLVTVGAFPGVSYTASSVLDFTGFFIIALAAGGMRPCVAAFAADQFPPQMEEQRRQFFSFYYFAINLGALTTMLIIPALRAHVHCMGQTSCFPLAFGVPTVCIVFSALLFLSGKKFFRMVPTEKNIVGEVFGCIYWALKMKFSKKTATDRSPRNHWLDYARPKYSDHLINDIKALLSIIFLYLPLIPFWALYDQIGSTWVLQANAMDGQLGRMTILPDQFPLINAVFILILVPVFEGFVYPCLNKLNILKSPLKRMACGGIIAGSTFVVAGFVQIAINRRALVLPANHYGRLTFYNAYDLETTLTYGTSNFTAKYMESVVFDYNDTVYLTDNSSNPIRIEPNRGNFATLAPSLTMLNMSYPLVSTKDGQTRLYLLFDSVLDDLTTVHIANENRKLFVSYNETQFNVKDNAYYVDLEPGFLGLRETNLNIARPFRELSPTTVLPLEAGSAYVFVIFNDTSVLIQLISGNTVHIFWQLPQYFMITVAEILFSISGLDFSYSQSPESMKSVLQAIWLITGAFGNLLAAVISGSNAVSNPATEFYLYAIMMYVVMLVFILIARKYQYVNNNKEEEMTSIS